jgi:hypothetical protein
MLQILFLVGGIYMISTKKVMISSKRIIEGKWVMVLGIVYLVPFFSNMAVSQLSKNDLSYVPFLTWLDRGLNILVILVTLILVIFYKPKEINDVNHRMVD